MRVGALDLGSNSLKLLVVERDPAGRLRPVRFVEALTRVCEGAERTGELDEAATERTLRALGHLLEEARGLGSSRIGCVATAGLRGLGGRERFVDRARTEHGIEVEIIDGETEARLVFSSTAPAAGFEAPERLVVDVGGRSTELAVGRGAHPDAMVSMPVGAVRLAETLATGDPPAPVELESVALRLRASIEPAVRDLLATRSAARARGDRQLVGVSGTVVALAGLEIGQPDAQTVLVTADGMTLTRAQIRAQRSRLARLPANQRSFGSVLPAGRADVVVLGTMVLEAVMDAVEAGSLIVRAGGVASGLARHLFGATSSETSPRGHG